MIIIQHQSDIGPKYVYNEIYECEKCRDEFYSRKPAMKECNDSFPVFRSSKHAEKNGYIFYQDHERRWYVVCPKHRK